MVVSEVCAVSEVLCSVSDGHYTKFGNCSISDEEKGRRALGMHISHLIKRRRVHFVCVSHMGKGRRALTKRVSLLPKDNKHDIHQGMVLAPAGGIPVSFFLMGMQLPGARTIPWRTN
jgi:hypothetical protein